MSLATTHSRAHVGITAPLVTIETHIAKGLPALSIVGLAETAVKESKDRVRSAILNSQFEFPVGRITINLAPADLPKEGGRFDLPIALGILAATKQIPSQALDNYEFAGELALSGKLRPVKGILPFALEASKSGRSLIVAVDNADEAALPGKLPVLAAADLITVCQHLCGQQLLSEHICSVNKTHSLSCTDLVIVKGQERAKRALTIAAAGGHSLLMVGPPGSGKTLLASCLPGILPTMTEEEALSVASIMSLSSQAFTAERWGVRPFRAPHHTASNVALVGGGSLPRPGEVSLAHHGVLFLDELPEFSRYALETLREPLQSGRIVISRAAQQIEYPANFQLVAAMNPCPCGYLGDPDSECSCSDQQIARYRAKISGPLLDRIDMQIEVAALPHRLLTAAQPTNTVTSADLRQLVNKTRKLQLSQRGKVNSNLPAEELDMHCPLSIDAQKLLNTALEKMCLSARSYHRLLRVARTIADLDAASVTGVTGVISAEHLAEALSFNKKSR